MAENFLNMMENIIQKIQETQQISSTKKIKHKKNTKAYFNQMLKTNDFKNLNNRQRTKIHSVLKEKTNIKKKKVRIIENS